MKVVMNQRLSDHINSSDECMDASSSDSYCSNLDNEHTGSPYQRTQDNTESRTESTSIRNHSEQTGPDCINQPTSTSRGSQPSLNRAGGKVGHRQAVTPSEGQYRESQTNTGISDKGKFVIYRNLGRHCKTTSFDKCWF